MAKDVVSSSLEKYTPKSRADICLYGKLSDVDLPKVGAKVTYEVTGTVKSIAKRQYEGDTAPSVDIGITIAKVSRGSVSDRIAERQRKYV